MYKKVDIYKEKEREDNIRVIGTNTEVYHLLKILHPREGTLDPLFVWNTRKSPTFWTQVPSHLSSLPHLPTPASPSFTTSEEAKNL